MREGHAPTKCILGVASVRLRRYTTVRCAALRCSPPSRFPPSAACQPLGEMPTRSEEADLHSHGPHSPVSREIMVPYWARPGLDIECEPLY
jgi:hypothetical protein